jgi:hypothetical protein
VRVLRAIRGQNSLSLFVPRRYAKKFPWYGRRSSPNKRRTDFSPPSIHHPPNTVKRFIYILSLALCSATAFSQTLENDRYLLERSPDGLFTLTAKPSNRVFLMNARFGLPASDPGVSKFMPIFWKNLGIGQGMEITSTNGARTLVGLHPSMPFVLIIPCAAQEEVIKEADIFSGLVDARNSATFGTGGLLSADKNPGSYAWQAVVNPTNRSGVVFGWITHDQGSGVIFTKSEGQSTRVTAKVQFGQLHTAPKQSLETFAIGYFEDARLGLEAWADAVATQYSIKLKPQPTGYCTWYSRPNGGASDEKHIAQLADFAAKELAPFGFSVVQIDDKWQAGISTNGPHRDFMQHAANGPYPSGMKAAADHIKSDRLTPGIWFMPFAGTSYDPAFADRQDYFVKRADGKSYETSWGGTCLDMTYEPARNYLRDLAHRITQDWGFNYIKVDGLWTGTATRQQYVNSGYKDDNMGDAKLHDPLKTNIEAYRLGLKTLREGAGPDTFILGCNGPQNMRSYSGAFGLVDAMRIGPDNGAEWNRLTRGPVFGSRHYFLHDRIWHNDPDPVYVRESMPLKHAQLICSWVAISGQLNLSSEWLPGLPPERLDILKRTMPGHGLKPRPADLFENDPPSWWLLTNATRNIVAIYNWSDKEAEMTYPLDKLGLNSTATYNAFDYWQNSLLTPIEREIKLTLPAQSCRILSLLPTSANPQVISTSRHVTQGIIDLLSETYDSTTQILSGQSKVIAHDPYELRIIARNKQIGSITLSDQDYIDGNKVTSIKAEGDLIRIRIESPTTRVVTWHMKF